MSRYHTHGCPECGVITIHHCSGRNAGEPDCPPLCEHEADHPDDLYCDECWEVVQEKRDREDREDHEAHEAASRAERNAHVAEPFRSFVNAISPWVKP